MRKINFVYILNTIVKVTSLILICCTSILPISSCKKSTDNINEINKDKKEITETINNVFGWAVNKNFDLFFKSIANDTNFISVTPYKRVKFGFADVKKDSAFWGSPYFKAIRHEIRDLRINISKSNDIAWFYCVVDDINEWKGEPANWENVRWTGVLEKRNDRWIIVQQHFSFAKED
jgi:hypothetical protein